MNTTMDSAGRLVIPKEIRRLSGIQAGTPLDVRWHDGRIEIEPGTLPVSLERRGRLLVAVPETEVEPLTALTVDDARRAIERERIGV
jgi:AbrB family looped-hinge helix DNA binding protein